MKISLTLNSYLAKFPPEEREQAKKDLFKRMNRVNEADAEAFKRRETSKPDKEPED